MALSNCMWIYNYKIVIFKQNKMQPLKKKKDDRMCALIFIDGKLTLFLGSFGKLTANFGLFHFNKANVLKIPPSLYTVRRPSLKPRH